MLDGYLHFDTSLDRHQRILQNKNVLADMWSCRLLFVEQTEQEVGRCAPELGTGGGVGRLQSLEVNRLEMRSLLRDYIGQKRE